MGSERFPMLLLVILLAQGAPPSDDAPAHVPFADIAGLQQRWEELNSACRRLRNDSVEGQNACHGRDVIQIQLGQRGRCLRQIGVRIEWESCPRR